MKRVERAKKMGEGEGVREGGGGILTIDADKEDSLTGANACQRYCYLNENRGRRGDRHVELLRLDGDLIDPEEVVGEGVIAVFQVRVAFELAGRMWRGFKARGYGILGWWSGHGEGKKGE